MIAPGQAGPCENLRLAPRPHLVHPGGTTMMDNPMFAVPLALVWAPAIVVGSVWARRSLMYGLITMGVAIPFLIAFYWISWLAMIFLGWFVAAVFVYGAKLLGMAPPDVDLNQLAWLPHAGAHLLTLWMWIMYLRGIREQRTNVQWAPGMSGAPTKPKSNPFQRRWR